MSNNKYWEIWMERKKNLLTTNNNANNRSLDKILPVNANETRSVNKSFNSFVSDRQN